MAGLSEGEIENIHRNMLVARDGLRQAAEQLQFQRGQLVRATIEATDLVVYCQNINKTMPDPSALAGGITELEHALESLEDLIYNPQDKGEILSAIRLRSNHTKGYVENVLQRANLAASQVEVSVDQIAQYRNSIRRDAFAFCALVVLAAGIIIWSVT